MSRPKLIQVPPEKITLYLLNLAHPDGWSKAKFFMGRGFSLIAPNRLADALVDHAARFWPGTTIAVADGIKHRIEGPMVCPDGTAPIVHVVWKIETGSDLASLITARKSKLK